MRHIIIRPLVNEKSMLLSKSGFYTFEIGRDIGKKIVETVIREQFKVDVVSVKTINVKGKRKQQRSRKGVFSTQGYRKAIVQVKKGQKIVLFEQASEPEEEKKVEVRTAEGEKIADVKEKKSFLKGTKVKIEKEADRAEETKETKRQRGKLETHP